MLGGLERGVTNSAAEGVRLVAEQGLKVRTRSLYFK